MSEESLIRTDEVVVSEVTLPRDVRELSLALLMDDEDGKTLLGKEPKRYPLLLSKSTLILLTLAAALDRGATSVDMFTQ